MSYTTAELAKMLANNPHLELVTDGSYTTPMPKAAAGKLSEHDLQAAVIAACDERAKTDPRWACIFAIPNGGARDKATAGKLKAEGVRAGIPDLFVAVPSGQFAGLFVEIKVSPNRPRTNQMEWLQRLRQRGYSCVVCYDTVEAVINAIIDYLEDK